MRDDRLSRMLLYKIIADLWWGIWAMIQSKISKIDFDFFEYGTNRFNRLRKNAFDSGYRNWIESL
ncbi:MAG: hypothetical protein GH155_06910 [Spirochaeta sp.]|nr:hypothetical protein [Spirochaeta sp.]